MRNRSHSKWPWPKIFAWLSGLAVILLIPFILNLITSSKLDIKLFHSASGPGDWLNFWLGYISLIISIIIGLITLLFTRHLEEINRSTTISNSAVNTIFDTLTIHDYNSQKFNDMLYFYKSEISLTSKNQATKKDCLLLIFKGRTDTLSFSPQYNVRVESVFWMPIKLMQDDNYIEIPVLFSNFSNSSTTELRILLDYKKVSSSCSAIGLDKHLFYSKLGESREEYKKSKIKLNLFLEDITSKTKATHRKKGFGITLILHISVHLDNIEPSLSLYNVNELYICEIND